MRVLVVLPTYQEAENIEDVLRKVRSTLPDAGILVVDDGSPDGTAQIAERVGADVGGVDVMRRQAKSGLGSAYRAGFAWGRERGFEVLVEMDSDLSHDPEALVDLVAPFAKGYDLVVGSRYVPGGSIPNWRWHRRLLSRAGNLYAKLMLGIPVSDSTSGFRAYAANLFDTVDLEAIHADGYGFQIEMVLRAHQAGARICEVPIRFVDRERGTSKMSMNIMVEALWLVTKWGLGRFTGRSPSRREAGGG